MIHLRAVDKKRTLKSSDEFPFNIPLIKNFASIEFNHPVTFFVGENGSGKSTLLEAIAAGAGCVAVGRADIAQDATLAPARKLGAQLKLSWQKRTTQGFFLRAEDFFNFTRRINSMGEELAQMAAEFEEKLRGPALDLAKGVVLGQRAALVKRYGQDLDANSHGESFLKLFQARFVAGGLYLLDEPEAPLSPMRQLSLLAMLKEMVAAQGQFIIATHSPILMAFPEAAILSFDSYPVKAVAYEDLEHVTITRDFLNNPCAFLRHL